MSKKQTRFIKVKTSIFSPTSILTMQYAGKCNQAYKYNKLTGWNISFAWIAHACAHPHIYLCYEEEEEKNISKSYTEAEAYRKLIMCSLRMCCHYSIYIYIHVYMYITPPHPPYHKINWQFLSFIQIIPFHYCHTNFTHYIHIHIVGFNQMELAK